MPPNLEIAVSVSALLVVLIKAREFEAAEGLYDWWQEYFPDDDSLEEEFERAFDEEEG